MNITYNKLIIYFYIINAIFIKTDNFSDFNRSNINLGQARITA